jgi:hypothetical protein
MKHGKRNTFMACAGHLKGYFSSVKRIFGEDTRGTSEEGMVLEVKMKFLFYNRIVHAV